METHRHDLFIRTNSEFGRRLSFRQFGRGWEIVDVQNWKTQCRYEERTRLLGSDWSGQDMDRRRMTEKVEGRERDRHDCGAGSIATVI